MNQQNFLKSPGTGMTLSELIDKLTNLAAKEADPEVEFVELKAGQVLFEQGQAGLRFEERIQNIAGDVDVSKVLSGEQGLRAFMKHLDIEESLLTGDFADLTTTLGYDIEDLTKLKSPETLRKYTEAGFWEGFGCG